MAAAEVQPDSAGELKSDPASEKPPQFLLRSQGKEPAGVSPKKPVQASAQPPEQSRKTTLRALQLAAETEKALASAKEQAASAAGLLRIAEQQLVEEKKFRVTETDRLATQLAGLNENLSAAVLHTALLEAAGRRERRRMLGVCAVLIFGVLAVTTLLVQARRQPQPAAPTPVLIKKSVQEGVTIDSGRSAEARALDRFITALSLLPEGSVPAVLRSANRLLLDSGAQPCSVESASGQPALLFGAGAVPQQQGPGPLARTLSRCAEAVEKTLLREEEYPGEGTGTKK
jgi:hypothetical protein